MGLKSFYLAVNCHFFFAGLRPAPRWGPRRPPDPRVRPCSASRSPKRQVRLSAEVTSGRPTSKKTAMYITQPVCRVSSRQNSKSYKLNSTGVYYPFKKKRSGNLRAQVRVPGRAVHAIPLWDELRTWDPGD